MNKINTVDDAKRYIQQIIQELKTFSDGEQVVTVLNGSRESEITAEILRRALGKLAVTPDVRSLEREGMALEEYVIAMYTFWKEYIQKYGPVTYCFGVTADNLQHWDSMADETGITAGERDPKGLFEKRFEALRGVNSDELGLLEKALSEL